MTKLEEKEGALTYVAQSMAEIEDLDGALKLVQTLGKYGRPSGIQAILESFADDDFHSSWDGSWTMGGIKIVIGAGFDEGQGSRRDDSSHAEDCSSRPRDG